MNSAKSIFASAAIAFTASTFVQTALSVDLMGELEVSKVISVVSSIPLAIDLAAYDLAEKAFAPKVTIDYTSLWGGQPNTMTPSEVIAAWRNIVPGFDATWHELSNVKASVIGSKATATAFVDGRHWLGGQLWRPIGNYNWDLEEINGKWKVTRMQFSLTQEIGNRVVATKAMELAKTKTAKSVANNIIYLAAPSLWNRLC
jgi:SnoaL-like domain